MTTFYATPNERSPRANGSFYSGKGFGNDSRYGLAYPTSQTLALHFPKNQALAALWNEAGQ